MDTILLDTVEWDLVLDVDGDIAVASDPYSQAQDAASAARLFQGELWFDTVPGVPYWTQILGLHPPLALIKQKLVDAALRVPGVVAAKCFLSSTADRVLRGQIQVTNEDGVTSAAGF